MKQETRTLKATRRNTVGTRVCRSLRSQGQLPGIIYGHGKETIPFVIERHNLEVELQHGHRLLSLALEGTEESYLIKEVQYDHLGIKPVHLDLARVRLDEKVEVSVPLFLRGTPKGASEGGVLTQVLNALKVECLASNIPDEIRGSVTELNVGDELIVSQIVVPEGVRILNKPDDLVAILRIVAEEAPPTEVTEAVPTEPEVIAKGKVEEEPIDGEPTKEKEKDKEKEKA